MQNGLNFFSGLRWIGVQNQNAADVPAFAVLRVTGYGSAGALTVNQPSADGQDGCLLASDRLIQGTAGAVVGYGLATADAPAWALYDAADGVPAAGETWGPGAGSWKLRKDKPGFLIYGGADGVKVLVTRAGGGGGSGSGPTVRVVTCVSIVTP